MEPRIQYVKTSDGVNIAYCTAGSGPALVWVQPPFPSHVQLEWEQPILRRVFETIITAGMTLASATDRPLKPCTFSLGSTTASESTPILQVPTGWK